MRPAGFEPAVPASERLQTKALDRAETGIGGLYTVYPILHHKSCTQNTASVNSVRVQAVSAFELLRMQVFFFFPNFIYFFVFLLLLFFALPVSITRGKLIRIKFLLVLFFFACVAWSCKFPHANDYDEKNRLLLCLIRNFFFTF
jgi:hypothetical protein